VLRIYLNVVNDRMIICDRWISRKMWNYVFILKIFPMRAR